MCVYVIMLICVCILCYYVYSVKSSWELVFIVYKNQIQIKFSYLILSYLIATPNNYRIIAQSGYWKYDHECRKMHQIKRVCGTCYVHKFNLNAFRHEWSYIQYSRRAIDYYIYFIDENLDELPNRLLPNLAHLLILCVFTSVLCWVNKEVKENNNNNQNPNPILAFYIHVQTRGAQTTI